MKLELALALSGADDVWLVERLDSGSRAQVGRSAALKEHEVAVRVGNVVVVDTQIDPPEIVHRWRDLVAEWTGAGVRLTRSGARVDPAALRAETFPGIEHSYAQWDLAHARDPKEVVREGYDRIAERYVAWVEQSRSAARQRHTDEILEQVAPGAAVLELGCGAGGPTTRALAERFDLTGVDISSRTIELARERVPGARFIAADMMNVDFPAGTFAAIAAFYSLIHLPRTELPDMLARIVRWLEPGGSLFAVMGARSQPLGYGEEFFDVPMIWSSYDPSKNRRLIEEAGLEVVQSTLDTEQEHGESVSFLWLWARKPGPLAAPRQSG